MITLLVCLLIVFIVLISAYETLSLNIFSLKFFSLTLLLSFFTGPTWPVITALIFFSTLYILVKVPLLRLNLISKPAINLYTKMLPPLSSTERDAINAGTVGFEAELFSGRPDWKKLNNQPKPTLSEEEQDFLDGPVEKVCSMTSDWEVTHDLADLPKEVWDYIKTNKFFGMIIPKEYGGLGFSAYAHSCVIIKLTSVSSTLSSTVGVPNSLGPGELLLHYGTEEQKKYYLPRLADGREVPCFGLTAPHAGSDATSIPDTGVVCYGEWNGEKVLGVKLNFEKRYITLAPVATLIGLAFKLYDPEKLLSENYDRGITLALIPRDTKGMDIGKRHFPLNCAFQNGPIYGKDVFIPISQLIGGEAYIGKGWSMLVECLSVGRAITLPSTSSASSKLAAVSTGVYARIRKQFGLSIGRFEGVEEALARIVSNAYACSALSQSTAAAVDRGEKPAVTSAIAKYHCTEMARESVKDAMDIHGGKGIILGPKNYLGRVWQAAPISITVEGANIMTRSLMIFGQGSIRCHPYVLKEMQSVLIEDEKERLKQFDYYLFKHIGSSIYNAVYSFLMASNGMPKASKIAGCRHAHYYHILERYSSNLAIISDISMLTLGGKLKVKESLSARLGDVLSYLYIASVILKRFEDDGRPESEIDVLNYTMQKLFYKIEYSLENAIRNFPIKFVSSLLHLIIIQLGFNAKEPNDRLAKKVASSVLSDGDVKTKLSELLYTTPTSNNHFGLMCNSLDKIIASEPIERKFAKAMKGSEFSHLSYDDQLNKAEQLSYINKDELNIIKEARKLINQAIEVDAFEQKDLARR